MFSKLRIEVMGEKSEFEIFGFGEFFQNIQGKELCSSQKVALIQPENFEGFGHVVCLMR